MEMLLKPKNTATCSLCGGKFSFYKKCFDVLVDENNHKYRICPECTILLRSATEYSVEQKLYFSEKERWSRFFLAIRNQAILDNELDDWEKFWLYDQELKGVWFLFLS